MAERPTGGGDWLRLELRSLPAHSLSALCSTWRNSSELIASIGSDESGNRRGAQPIAPAVELGSPALSLIVVLAAIDVLALGAGLVVGLVYVLAMSMAVRSTTWQPPGISQPPNDSSVAGGPRCHSRGAA